MPHGPGTYGHKVGRPPKKVKTSKAKLTTSPGPVYSKVTSMRKGGSVRRKGR